MNDQVDTSKKTAKKKGVADEFERQIKEYDNNRVAYYDTLLKAWISNRVELYKQLLTLSVIAVGFLVTFSDKIQGSITIIIIWVLATSSFIISSIYIYTILGKNADYINVLLQKHQVEGSKEKKLSKKEKKYLEYLNSQKNKKENDLTFKTNIAIMFFLCGTTLTITQAILIFTFK